MGKKKCCLGKKSWKKTESDKGATRRPKKYRRREQKPQKAPTGSGSKTQRKPSLGEGEGIMSTQTAARYQKDKTLIRTKNKETGNPMQIEKERVK